MIDFFREFQFLCIFYVLDRRCVYWDVKTNAWSSDKCTVVSENADEVICQCDHLTNFGVIMDVNGNLDNVSTINSFSHT